MRTIIVTMGLMFSMLVVANADLSGTYDVGTLTPLERPQALGDSLFLTPAQAEKMSAGLARVMAADSQNVDPNRGPPPAGKITNGYNLFWVDPGSQAALINGKFRTSIITRPANGRLPKLTPQGEQRITTMLNNWQIVWRNPDPTVALDNGSAWWLNDGSPDGPYDHIEQRSMAERCIYGSRSTAGPPMLPNFYNNHKRIIQTGDHVMILTEMNHDARVIRLNTNHVDPSLRSWLGDSVGHWQGDTLKVDTTNFGATPPLSRSDTNLHVVEYFTLQADGNLLYRFEIDDPTVWSETWGGEYIWQAAAQDKVYEYACHEGNYALANVLKGARQLERDHLTQQGASR